MNAIKASFKKIIPDPILAFWWSHLERRLKRELARGVDAKEIFTKVYESEDWGRPEKHGEKYYSGLGCITVRWSIAMSPPCTVFCCHWTKSQMRWIWGAEISRLARKLDPIVTNTLPPMSLRADQSKQREIREG
jgi:hypothetical protein